MAYNLYHAQMAKGWVERIEKENATAEKFWYEHATKTGQQQPARTGSAPRLHTPSAPISLDVLETRSVASAATSAAPSGFSSKTSYLKGKMEKLEAELQAERESRKKVEQDLMQLKSSLRL